MNFYVLTLPLFGVMKNYPLNIGHKNRLMPSLKTWKIVPLTPPGQTF